jgi:transcriptional regulator with XRE-family HTH domain
MNSSRIVVRQTALAKSPPGDTVELMSATSLGSRLRQLREALGLTQDEVSMRSVDQDGRILRRIEVGHVESGRNMASTRRVRTSLARAFNATEQEIFDYLEGRVSLDEFISSRGKSRTRITDGTKSAREHAIELVVSDGYGTVVEVRRAASAARETLPAAKAAALGVLEWANLIETTLRQLRRTGDAAASSGINPTTAARGLTATIRTSAKRTA